MSRLLCGVKETDRALVLCVVESQSLWREGSREGCKNGLMKSKGSLRLSKIIAGAHSSVAVTAVSCPLWTLLTFTLAPPSTRTSWLHVTRLSHLHDSHDRDPLPCAQATLCHDCTKSRGVPSTSRMPCKSVTASAHDCTSCPRYHDGPGNVAMWGSSRALAFWFRFFVGYGWRSNWR